MPEWVDLFFIIPAVLIVVWWIDPDRHFDNNKETKSK
jgi:hypothetical protein